LRQQLEEEKREDVGQGDRFVGAKAQNQNNKFTFGNTGFGSKILGGRQTHLPLKGMFGPQPSKPM